MERINNRGWKMKIVDYIDAKNVVVEFEEPYVYRTTTRTNRFLSGNVKNPYAPTICNFGIVGNKYPTHTDDGVHYLPEYLIWTNMIKRCYDEEHRYKNPAYYDCECCSEWQYYEKFYEWLHAQENYEILTAIGDIAIDKDILQKGNREYAPNKCCLVPQRINNIMLKSDAIRGDCVIGVHYHNVNGTYIAQCGGHENAVYLGSYQTEMEAFSAYKQYKEAEIKELAHKEFLSGHITKKCYEALMRYEVEITD